MIPFASLTRATLLRRYKRFLADVVLADGSESTIHCPNPGAMTGLATPGATLWLAPGKAKLPWSWELTEVDGLPVGINANRANAIVADALGRGAIPELADYPHWRREVPCGPGSRIDFLLTGPDRPDLYLEIKNVHLCRIGGLAEFPDCPTARGARHLHELTARVAEGHHAAMLFVVQRMDCNRLSLAEDIDPAYGQAFRRAQAAGVRMLCYDCTLTQAGTELRAGLPIALTEITL